MDLVRSAAFGESFFPQVLSGFSGLFFVDPVVTRLRIDLVGEKWSRRERCHDDGGSGIHGAAPAPSIRGR